MTFAAAAFSPGRRIVPLQSSISIYQDSEEDEDGDEEPLPELDELDGPSCGQKKSFDDTLINVGASGMVPSEAA